MKRTSSIIFGIVLVFGLGMKPEGVELFDSSQMHHIRFETDDSLIMVKMSANHRAKKKKYLKVSMYLDGKKYSAVGIRQKGTHSNSFAWTPKKPLKVDINEFEEGQSHMGITKFNLANAFEDPSFLREVLSLYCLDELGLPAPKASIASVHLNSSNLGVYIVIEQINSAFLQERFGESEGNVYEGNGGCFDHTEQVKDKFYELKSNEEVNDRSRLRCFIRLVNQAEDKVFTDSLNNYLNVSDFLKCMAFDYVAANTDTYIWGRCHNFYLYEKSNGQFEWIPWDYNLSFGYDLKYMKSTGLPPNLNHKGFKLLDRTLTNDKWKREFDGYCKDVIELLTSRKVGKFITGRHKLIESYVLADKKAFYPYDRFKNSVDGEGFSGGLNAHIPSIKGHIKDQKARLKEQLD